MSEQDNLEFEPKAVVVQEEQKSLMETAPVNVVEAFIEEANRRVVCMVKMKEVIFKVTTINDWIDQGGKPYLGAPGAEAVATALSVGWDAPMQEVEKHDNGHKTYKFKAMFHFLGRSIPILGSRGSMDPFFSRANGQDIPPDAINMANVEKAAYTNLLNNGIKRVLGIRNMTWEQLKTSYGMDRSQAASVNYDPKVISDKQVKRLFAISKTAKWTDDDVSAFLANMDYSSSKDILKKHYEDICNHIEKNPK
jgi:hypothetical protein